MTRAAKALYRRYYGGGSRFARYRGETITARPTGLLSFLAGTAGYPGAVGFTRGNKCGPLPASCGRKRR